MGKEVGEGRLSPAPFSSVFVEVFVLHRPSPLRRILAFHLLFLPLPLIGKLADEAEHDCVFSEHGYSGKSDKGGRFSARGAAFALRLAVPCVPLRSAEM